MPGIGQTVTIVNKSGNVVKTSKQLVSVFTEAKSAYNERKAEIKAERTRKHDKEAAVRKRLEALDLENDASQRSSRRGSEDGRSTKRSKRTKSRPRDRPPVGRGVSDSFHTNDSVPHRRQASHKPSPLREVDEPRNSELIRRHTHDIGTDTRRRPHRSVRSASLDDIDMNLAYGELPPSVPERKTSTELELRQKMSGLQVLLDECNCVQHSVTSMIDNLQKNPETLAAVGLALGEISTIAAKMAPGALTAMKGSFPAVIALLASPQFMIAAGVGVGVTIIALGGYKIVRRVQGKKDDQLLEDGSVANDPDTPLTGMDELQELNHIERWRRGIAQAEAESLGTSVDGEFITPRAKKTLIDEGRLTEADLKSGSSEKKKKKKKKSHEAKTSTAPRDKGEGKELVKRAKEPSALKMLFKGRSNVSAAYEGT